MKKKNVYSVDVMVGATAYIRAYDAEEARQKAQALSQQSPQILDHDGEVEVSGLRYDDPDLPDVSLSPAMTIHGVWPGVNPELSWEEP